MNVTMRSQAVHFTGKLTYREQLEQLWRANPTATLAAARQATGASQSVARSVRQRLVDAGVLRRGPERWAA